MGNRAVIETRSRDVGVYLHWNGGRDSVEGFLRYCKLKGYRPPEEDGYGWARLCQVVGNFFGGGLSVGIDVVDRLDEDNWDNGVYIIEGWEIVDRLYLHGDEQAEYDLMGVLMDVNEAQPESERLPKEFLDIEADDGIDPNDLRPGDLILYCGGGDAYTGGTVTGKPFVNEHGVTIVPVDSHRYGPVAGHTVSRTIGLANR